MSAFRPSLPRIYRPTPANLARLAAALRRGEIVGVPSETVYGLAADALSEAACARIFESKGRPTTDPLIVHLASARELERVAVENSLVHKLAAACWPGPLTLVLPKRPQIPDLITAGKATVAVRVPDHALFRKLIRLSGRPLAAPSANAFGYISPTTARHVRDGLAGTSLRAVLDGGECAVGVESTILDISDPARPTLLRPGGLAVEVLERVLGGAIRRPIPAKLPANVSAPAPGMLARHYSPRTPLTLHPRIDAAFLARLPAKEAVLLLRAPDGGAISGRRTDRARVLWLSEDGDMAVMARNLFAKLRALDAGGWTRLHAELPAGTEGLAPALRDRLTRAAAKR